MFEVQPSQLPTRGFIPPTAASVNAALDEFFAAGIDVVPGCWRAALAPHAGWVFSGRVAADVYRRVEIPDRVVVLCPKHTRRGANCAAAPVAGWSFPHADVASDPSLARALASGVSGIELDMAPHEMEHAIEAHLPLLAYRNPQVRVVGVTIGKMNETACLRFASELATVIGNETENAFCVISSDMNHFGTDAENRKLDALALDRLAALDTAGLVAVCRQHNITMCGLWPAVIVLEMLRLRGELSKAHPTGYATSADASADASGDKQRVVGYAGMLFGNESIQ